MILLTFLIVLSLLGLVLVSRRMDAFIRSFKIHSRLDSALTKREKA